MPKYICVISVISDVYTDQRVLRTAAAIAELNYDIHIIGRTVKQTSMFDTSLPCSIQHIYPWFKKGLGMYLFFNIVLFLRLFYFVLKNRKHKILLYANDLDTLLPNYFVSKLFHLSMIYDSHELFTEVPELQNKPLKKKIWEYVERYVIPKLPFAITVNESISTIFEKKYRTPFYFVLNVSFPIKVSDIKNRADLNLPESKKILILQGTGINIHRGAEELIQAMQFLDDNYLLLIIGGGDVIYTLKNMTKKLNLNEKVFFYERMSADELYHYTCNADIGISIDKPNNLNYLYSLPNKIFSYIHAHIPILASYLPEIEKIILRHNIGTFIEHHEPKHIAEKIQEALSHSEYKEWKQNTYKASEEYNWTKEKEKLKNIIQKYINH